MWKIDPPNLLSSEVAKDCAKGARDKPLRSLVSQCAQEFDSNSADYSRLASKGLLHTATRQTFPLNGISDTQIISLYEKGMVVRQSGRRHYNSISMTAKFKRCSYCQYVKATTLDHFIPKNAADGIPALAVEPLNLVPVCKDCNHALLTYWGISPSTEFLHPYFVPKIGRWLYARVRHTNPIEIEYYADPDKGLDATIRKRVVHQFDKLGLSEVYSSALAKDLVGFASYFPELGNDEEVKGHLLAEADRGLASDPNDLRGVLFAVLADDKWYCSGGYSKI